MLILASQSPRRKELLGLLGMPFTVRVPHIDETMDPAEPACKAVMRLSMEKAKATVRDAGDVVIAADTVVVCDGRILGKPKDEADAFRMLKMLSGRAHQVMTGVTVAKDEKTISHTEITQVHFRALTDQQIQSYIASGDPMDKAGSYVIQSGAARFVTGIEGDYFNVVGLPVCRLWQMLQEMEETK